VGPTQLELFPAVGRRLDDVKFVTVAEAALRVRWCERTIRRAIRSGALPAGRVRSGEGSRGAVRIRPADLERWMFSDGA
jgi:excisionase family DNA binding protein